jgi:hypothetical protein
MPLRDRDHIDQLVGARFVGDVFYAIGVGDRTRKAMPVPVFGAVELREFARIKLPGLRVGISDLPKHHAGGDPDAGNRVRVIGHSSLFQPGERYHNLPAQFRTRPGSEIRRPFPCLHPRTLQGM